MHTVCRGMTIYPDECKINWFHSVTFTTIAKIEPAWLVGASSLIVSAFSPFFLLITFIVNLRGEALASGSHHCLIDSTMHTVWNFCTQKSANAHVNAVIIIQKSPSEKNPRSGKFRNFICTWLDPSPFLVLKSSVTVWGLKVTQISPKFDKKDWNIFFFRRRILTSWTSCMQCLHIFV